MAKNVRETAKTEFELTKKNSYKIKKSVEEKKTATIAIWNFYNLKNAWIGMSITSIILERFTLSLAPQFHFTPDSSSIAKFRRKKITFGIKNPSL